MAVQACTYPERICIAYGIHNQRVDRSGWGLPLRWSLNHGACPAIFAGFFSKSRATETDFSLGLEGGNNNGLMKQLSMLL